MNAIPSFVSAASAAACAAPVCTSAVAGTSGWRARTSSSGEIPVLAATKIESKCPSLSNSACAVGTSNTANVALPIESTEPNLAMPVISYSFTGPSAATPTRSPTPKPWSLAVFASSENPEVRAALGVERSTYEGPVGILSVIADQAERVGIPTVSLWASVPHYVHNAPSPKAVLALLGKVEELTGLSIPRGSLEDEAQAWEASVDALAADDEEMAGYIQQLEQARDAVDAPQASGEAIAQEFERYLRRRGDQPGGGPWRPRDVG